MTISWSGINDLDYCEKPMVAIAGEESNLGLCNGSAWHYWLKMKYKTEFWNYYLKKNYPEGNSTIWNGKSLQYNKDYVEL